LKPTTKKNVIANYLGQGWSAVMSLSFVPFYIKYLGIEGYGLIGFFAVMLAWLALLDMGMTPTLNREMARFASGAYSSQSIQNLLRSIEIICFSLAALIALGVWAASDFLAKDWVKSKQIPTDTVTHALAIMALVAALRFCEGIYRGSLLGLQRQVWYNVANAALATLRHAGALAILIWVSPTLDAFFYWQAAISMLTVSVLAIKVHESLPKAPGRAKFSSEALAVIWKFALGVMGVSLLGMLLGQVHTLLLSRLLPLSSFGYYSVAATIVGAIYLIIGPITTAVYPRLVELFSSQDHEGLAAVYHQGAQLVTVLIAPAAVLLSFFPAGVVFVWSGNADLARNAAPLISVLVWGHFMNGLMWLPGQCCFAYGWTSLGVKANMVAVPILVPAIFWAVPRYGAMGAAWIWVALNAFYVLIVIQLMHRRLIQKEKWHWYFADVFLPFVGALGVMLLARAFQPVNYQSRVQWCLFLLPAGTVALALATLLADRTRARVLNVIVAMRRLQHESL
jgi:O-antigen/teichoic acid export membrane protein